ncbi:MAG: ATP-dependent DNA helicase RecG [Proteobacteria bacterium]|nr:ATP-dependent DNA helicase RecG [Pseudomonadota bacterium]
MSDAPVTPPLARPVTALRGVGPRHVELFQRLGIVTVGDLLLHAPRRYEDRRTGCTIAQLQLRQPATVLGKIVAQGVNYFAKRTKSVFEFILDDGTARLHCRWWNLPWLEEKFHVGDEVFVHGRPLSLKPRTMDHPETEVVETGDEASTHLHRVVPVYPLTEGLGQRWLRGLLWRTLEEYEGQIPERHAAMILPARERVVKISVSNTGGGRDEVGPATDGQSAPLPARASQGEEGKRSVASLASTATSALSLTCAGAIRFLHFPSELKDAELARQRLALDEFLDLQLAVRARREKLLANARTEPCKGDNHLIRPYLAQLGFPLTESQTTVLREIRADLARGTPMRRLLQGDVGAGKTVVAACTALMALESGHNVALMAPTEILAEQHFRNFTKWLEPLGVGVELRTGSRKTVESREPRVEGRAGQRSTLDPRPSTLFIGTHALVEDAFTVERLGLVIIDEQHKFGVAQRERLLRKGHYPHLLVMTATPIPRTLGLTIYGDLDVSVIAHLPPGRGVIKTFVRGPEKLPKVWAFVRERLAEGRQAYVVYPRVEDTDLKTGTKAVMAEFEKLAKELAPHRLGLLHGRLSAEEKEQGMSDFRANRVQALLATSVIEVGVDVANATVMVIENAEQFGLAQLHQLRGRIGRGAHDSWCVLVAAKLTEDARARLKVLEETTDGFAIAEADLRLRGPGELLGQAQSGAQQFKFADLTRDLELAKLARDLVTQR